MVVGMICGFVPHAAGIRTQCMLSTVAQVKYKEVMKQYGLGPNGGILTSCNLFATKFDKVLVVEECFQSQGVDV